MFLFGQDNDSLTHAFVMLFVQCQLQERVIAPLVFCGVTRQRCNTRNIRVWMQALG